MPAMRCSGHKRSINAAAVAYFLENGFKNVASMSGRFEAWRQVYEYETDR